MLTARNPLVPRHTDSLFNLFDSFFQDHFAPTNDAGDLIAPRTNIAESEKDYQISMELPGVDEKDIQVEMNEGHLIVSAERKDERETKDKTWHRVEHRYGRFERTLTMPKGIDGKQIKATYDKGVLHLTVPKAAAASPTRIPVQRA
jgi:HSP20 family protein